MLTAFCGCLNVKIHIKGNRINEFPYPGNKLEFAESRDDFFLQGTCKVDLDSQGVIVAHNYLVHSRPAGRWNVFRCTCCDVDVYSMPHGPLLPVLVNPALLTDLAQVTRLQQSERFSPVFRILLPTLNSSGPSSPRVFPEKSLQTDSAVSQVQQLVSNFLKREEEQVEARIQQFTEQQQAALLALETRVRQDRNTLLMLLAKKETLLEKKMNSLSFAKEATPPTSPVKRASFHFHSPAKEPFAAASRRTVEIPDDDFLFEFDSENLDRNASNSDPFDIHEFDNEDSSRDEGISIPRPNQRAGSDHDSALAKSLPMRVPTLSNYRTQEIDIDEIPKNSAEMAASIQAIARSVHGASDSFWDLPRPRLNTLH